MSALSRTVPLQPRSDPAVLAALLALVALLAAAGLAAIYGKGLASGSPIRADAVGYYIYLPAILIDHDVGLTRTLERSVPGGVDQSDFRPVRDGYVDQHQTGEAIMLAPFFGAGELAALATGARRDGFSRPYQVAAAAGGLFYALVGLGALGLLLLRWFDRSTVLATLAAVTFGTNLFHYATYDAVYSHVFSFALVALVLVATLALVDHPTVVRAGALGLPLGLVTAVRPTNLLAALFPLCAVRGVVRRLRSEPGPRLWLLAAAAAAAFVIPIVPQLLYWHAVTGHLITNAYGGSPRLDVLHPFLADVAFSVRKGLFFWTPVLALAVAGVPLLRRYAPAFFLPALVFLPVHFWLVASWTEWWYGGSFGQRSFVDVLPVYALGLAALIAWARRRRATGWLVGGAVAVTSLLATHAMVEYWLGNIPFDHATWTTYLDSFGKA
jgi:hypothetical protein